jgi:hypothetical protein
LVAAASPPQIVASKGARDGDVASTVAAASPPQGEGRKNGANASLASHKDARVIRYLLMVIGLRMKISEMAQSRTLRKSVYSPITNNQ